MCKSEWNSTISKTTSSFRIPGNSDLSGRDVEGAQGGGEEGELEDLPSKSSEDVGMGMCEVLTQLPLLSPILFQNLQREAASPWDRRFSGT